VLCGGRSSRFGSDKALASFADSTVGGRVVAALRAADVDPVVAIGGGAGNRLGLPTVADRRPGVGPLGGLATALLWARHGRVVVVPCDLPLLDPATVTALTAAPQASAASTDGGLEPPMIATVDGQPNVSVGCWPATHGPRILRLVDGGRLALRAALDDIDWIGVEVDPTALADADTPEELARLERLATERADREHHG
jgi:molybdopterin-guanine dinucleotide biosynthesis protein A